MASSIKVNVSTGSKKICSGCGEGPHWDAKDPGGGSLLFVDFFDPSSVCKWNPATDKVTRKKFSVAKPNENTFIIPCDKGGYITSCGPHLVHFTDWTNEEGRIIAEVDTHILPKGQTRFNDAKCDPTGRLWAGTMAYETKPTVLPHEMGSLYSIECADLTINRRDSKMTIANGLAWSLDKKTMFFIDSIPGVMYAYDYDPTTGTIDNRKVLLENSKFEGGFPDGMSSDTEGNLWVVVYLKGKVMQFDPRTGTKLREVSLPGALRTTSCCFGGANYETLYVTSSAIGLQPGEVDENAGSVFEITGLGVKGLPPNNFAGST